MKLSAALPLLLCACAVQSPAQRAVSLSSPTLCYINYAGNVQDKIASSAELERRGFTCGSEDIKYGAQEYQAMKNRQRANRDAANAAALQYLMTRPPPPALPPIQPPIHCYTYGGYTTCQ